MPLFHPRVIEKHTKAPKALPSAHADILKAWAENLEKGTFNRETSHDSEFIQRILVDVLGYKGSSAGDQCTVGKNIPVGSGNVDTALGHFSTDSTQIVAPFELKSAKTRDLDAIMPGRNKSPVQQAWEYAMDAKGAKWVLVSNYREIRLYAIGYGRKDYEKFDLAHLTDPTQYARFMLLLSAESLLGDRALSLLKESENKDKEITSKLYQDYKTLRAQMIDKLTKDNPAVPMLDIIQHTQTILDRILFVAFAEDRNLLPDDTLKSCYEDRGKWNPQPAWENFKGLFGFIDKGNPPLIPGYNGGLFAQNDALNNLKVSDALCEGFKTIGSYDFDSDVSVNILGHIFEQSITDLEEIKASIGGEEEGFDRKKSKRKKDGIFYTPAYITRYIVEQVVGGWLNDRKKELGLDDLPEITNEDFSLHAIDIDKYAKKITQEFKTQRQKIAVKIKKHITFWKAYEVILKNIKILDPACGSGAFLNEVFDFLSREGEQVNEQLLQLTLNQHNAFKWGTYILANNIYGVDINRESVEITKLSLWLKTANRNEKLTYLDDNIKCGNSLIDNPAIDAAHAFQWEKEFSDIMKAGGFDVVVGNPPWGASFDTPEREYFKKAYANVHMRSPESFNYFIGRAEQLSRGYAGFIVPSSYLTQYEYTKSRQYLLSKNALLRVINLGDGVFEDVNTPTCILVWKKKSTDSTKGYYGDYRHVQRHTLNAKLFEQDGLLQVPESVFTVNNSKSIIDKCLLNSSLKEVGANIATGISSGLDKAFIYDDETIASLHFEWPILRKLVLGGEIMRYSMIPESGKYIAYLTSDTDLECYGNIKKAILPYREALSKRREAANGKIPWFSLHWPRRKDVFENPKIIIRQTASSIMASFDEDGWYCLKSAITIQLPTDAKLSYLYFLALLNSKLMDYVYQDMVGEKARIFPEVKPVQLFRLPIKNVSPQEQQPLIQKTRIMLAKNKELHDISSKFLALLKPEFGLEKPGEKLEQWYTLDFSAFMAELAKKKITPTLAQKAEWMEHFEKQKAVAATLKSTIDATGYEIDQTVYALYGLTPDEIATVEGATS